MDTTDISSGAKAVSPGITEIWKKTVDFFSDNYIKIFWCGIALVIGIIAIKIAVKFFGKILKDLKTDDMMQGLLMKLFKFVLAVVLLLILLAVAGIEMTGTLAVLSTVILAVGVALKENLSNLASGIVIVCSKLYRKGDYIEVDGKEGVIDRISLFFTVLYMYDKKKVIIPNTKIVGSSVVNVFSNPLRRITLNVGVAYESDVDLVKSTVVNAMLSVPMIKDSPAPFCGLKEFGESSLGFTSHCWCDSRDYWSALYAVNEAVFNELKKNGISIPYNQMEVRLRTDDVKMPVK